MSNKNETSQVKKPCRASLVLVCLVLSFYHMLFIVTVLADTLWVFGSCPRLVLPLKAAGGTSCLRARKFEKQFQYHVMPLVIRIS